MAMAFRQSEVYPENPVFAGHEVQIGNFPPVSIQELRNAGIHWSPQYGLGNIPTNLPLASTQVEKDRILHTKRKTIERLKSLANFTLLCSFVAMLVGIGTIVASAPDFNFPHVIGGAIITGTMYFVKILTVILTVYFTLAPAVGIAGIWSIVDCNKETKPEIYDQKRNRFTRYRRDYDRFSKCEPNKTALLTLAVASLVIGVLVYFMIVFMCCTLTTKARAFGIKSNYEKFLDYMAQKTGQAGHMVGPSTPFQQTYGVSGAHGLEQIPVFQQPRSTFTGTQFSFDNPQYIPPPPPTYKEIIQQ